MDSRFGSRFLNATTMNIVTSRVWRHRVTYTWRHWWRHQWRRRRHFSMGFLLGMNPLNRLLSDIFSIKVVWQTATHRHVDWQY